jgi:hypothetical protein
VMGGRFTRWIRWSRTRRTSGMRSKGQVQENEDPATYLAWREGCVNRSFMSRRVLLLGEAALGDEEKRED